MLVAYRGRVKVTGLYLLLSGSRRQLIKSKAPEAQVLRPSTMYERLNRLMRRLG